MWNYIAKKERFLISVIAMLNKMSLPAAAVGTFLAVDWGMGHQGAHLGQDTDLCKTRV